MVVKSITKKTLAAWAIASGLALGGCFIEGEPERRTEVGPTLPIRTGNLIVVWSIDRRRDPNECIKARATQIEVAVFDSNQREVGAWRQRCDAFRQSIRLNAGRFTSTAVLLDAAGVRRTTAVSIDQFTILGNDSIEVPVDFPASSFLQ